MKLIVPNEGLSNCTPTVADWPDARLATAIVRYGHPEKLPVAFTSVTPAVSPVRTYLKGAADRAAADIRDRHGPVEGSAYPTVGETGGSCGN